MAKANDDNKSDDVVKYKPIEALCNTEKVMYGPELGDRRERIKPYEDDRMIMKCIGRIIIDFKEKSKYVGTGTVFDVKDGNAYIITCAHNVVKTNSNTDEAKEAELSFTRETADKSRKYEVLDFKYHPEYKFRKSPGDLAIIKIKDDDEFYKKLFEEKKDKIKLLCPDGKGDDEKEKDKESKEQQNYGLYGYPLPDEEEEHSKVVSGQLWGMMANYDNKGKKDSNGRDIELYVRRNKSRNFFEYNAIDTEGGQSGSAIFIELSDGIFGIIGVHTGGKKVEQQNWGVALRKDKMDWIKKTVKSLE